MDPIVIPELTICNTGSVVNMVRRVGGKPLVLSKPDAAYRGHKFILPGIGSFDRGMTELRESGWTEFLESRASDGVPMLGICLGMQMLFDRSEEGSLPGLGLVPGDVVRLRPRDPALRVPHMGWNEINVVRDNPLIARETADRRPQRFYFVHTYHAVCANRDDLLALVHYGGNVAAAVRRGNIFGAQFHPEKSHRFGMDLIKNFVNL